MTLCKPAAMVTAVVPDPDQVLLSPWLFTVTVHVPESKTVWYTASCPPVKLASAGVTVHPGPEQSVVSESWQLLVTDDVKLLLLVLLPAAVVVRVKLDEPLGLLIVTRELAGK